MSSWLAKSDNCSRANDLASILRSTNFYSDMMLHLTFSSLYQGGSENFRSPTNLWIEIQASSIIEKRFQVHFTIIISYHL